MPFQLFIPLAVVAAKATASSGLTTIMVEIGGALLALGGLGLVMIRNTMQRTESPVPETSPRVDEIVHASMQAKGLIAAQDDLKRLMHDCAIEELKQGISPEQLTVICQQLIDLILSMNLTDFSLGQGGEFLRLLSEKVDVLAASLQVQGVNQLALIRELKQKNLELEAELEKNQALIQVLFKTMRHLQEENTSAASLSGR